MESRKYVAVMKQFGLTEFPVGVTKNAALLKKSAITRSEHLRGQTLWPTDATGPKGEKEQKQVLMYRTISPGVGTLFDALGFQRQATDPKSSLRWC
jgi:hypothetical protein